MIKNTKLIPHSSYVGQPTSVQTPVVQTNNKETQPKINQQTRGSSICAILHVSESEIQAGHPTYDSTWESEHSTFFLDILWDLGLNTNQEYTRDDAITHRNRLNQVVTCSRWRGNERGDTAWLSSGYASKEAMDRSLNNNLLDDTYRSMGCTTDVQDFLEARDKYREDEVSDPKVSKNKTKSYK